MNQFSLSTRLWAFVVLVFSSFTVAGQCTSDDYACNYDPNAGPYCLDTEVVAVHTEGPLAGMITYRLYLNLATPEDVVSAIFGDSEYPLEITTTTTFYQDPLGDVTPNGINPLLFGFAPELEFDSWMTLGIDQVPNASAGQGPVSVVLDPAQNWGIDFESGGNIYMNTSVGGAVFATSDLTNGVPDADGRVLLAQLTTDGALGGTLNVQVFPNGELGGAGELGTYEVGSICECYYPTTYYVDNDGDGYGTTPVELCEWEPGYALQSGDCNDNSLIAYPGNPMDFVGDGIDGNCDGQETCFRDVDNDGYRSADTTDLIGSPFNINCSEFGEAYAYQPIDCDDTNPDLTIPDADGNCVTNLSSADEGCGDPFACNFDPEVPIEEDNCEYLTCRGCSNPGACNYDPEALIQTELICDYISCAGCTDPNATNYNPEASISDDSGCIYSGILAIASMNINYIDAPGPDETYTNEVYALLPPDAIRLRKLFGIKGGDVRLRIEPFGSVVQAATCDEWMPHDMVINTVVDGVQYTNLDCLSDSWFTIGGSIGYGPDLVSFGFDPATLGMQDDFDSELLALEGDSLGWELVGDVGGEPGNHCDQLGNRPGCAHSVRVARLTMPLGVSFLMQAGLTYEVAGGAERSITGQTITDDTSTISESGGGGEADSDDAVITDGEANIINGCLDATACNYDASANTDSGACDYESCQGCTYPDADNYDDTSSVDDGSCTFSATSSCPFDVTGDGLIGAADLLEFLASFDTACPE